MADTLDRSRPYGESFGFGASYVYTQDNNEFDGEGNLIGNDCTIINEVNETVQLVDSVDPVAEPEDENAEGVDDGFPLHKLPIVQLKEILATYKEAYVNKAQAIAFIEAQRYE